MPLEDSLSAPPLSDTSCTCGHFTLVQTQSAKWLPLQKVSCLLL